MRTVSRNVRCPVCGAPSSVTLHEDRDPLRNTEGHRITFRCSVHGHEPPEWDLLKLWADAGMKIANDQPLE